MFNLYRAREDLELAKRIASEMAIDGVIERASWPLTLAKLWLSVGITAITLIAILFVLIGSAAHWSLAIPALPLAGAIYGIIRVWRGMNVGVERVTSMAKQEINRRVAGIKPSVIAETSCPNNSSHKA